MQRTKTVLLCSAAATACFFFAVGYAFAQSNSSASALSEQSDSSASAIPEVIVTAQKRAENIRDVGMSIQSLSSDELLSAGITDTSQLGAVVPGFKYNISIYGTPVYTMRGMGFQDTTLSAGPTVTVYSNEIPIPFSAETSGALLDVERVEVLKGPQGTLYGENATGGLVNYISARPTSTFEAGSDLSYGRFNDVDLSGFVSGPLTDTLEARLALRTEQADGWQYNYAGPGHLGSKNFINGRLMLDWTPAERLDLLLSLNAWRDKSETPAPQFFGISPLIAGSTVSPAVVNFPLAPHNDRAASWLQNCLPPVAGAYRFTSCTNFERDNTFLFPSLRTNYDLGDNMTLTALSTYQKFKRFQPVDGDGISYNDASTLQRGSVETYYQEIRLAGEWGGKGSWIVGGNYEHDDIFDEFDLHFADGSGNYVFGLPLLSDANFSSQTVSTYSAFADAEYPILDNVTVQAGIRYTNVNRHFEGCGEDNGNGDAAAVFTAISAYARSLIGEAPLAPDVAGGCISMHPATNAPNHLQTDDLAELSVQDLKESNVPWRLGVNWKVTPENLLYVNLSRGFKSGTFPTAGVSYNIPQLLPAVQESVTALEGGFKSRLFDNTLSVDGAGFYYRYKNKQLEAFTLDPIFVTLYEIQNIPRSHVTGFELDATWAPIRGFTIAPFVSYTYTNVDRYSGYTWQAIPEDFAGSKFPDVPDWQANVDAQYEWTVKDKFKAFVGLDVNYTGYANSLLEKPSFAGYNLWDEPAHTLLDLRAGLSKDSWRLTLWGRNVTDTWYWTHAYHTNDALIRFTGMPATFGVTLSWRYH